MTASCSPTATSSTAPSSWSRLSPTARAAGLREGDIIVGFAGAPVADADSLQKLLAERPLGAAYPLQILRGTELLTLSVSPEGTA